MLEENVGYAVHVRFCHDVEIIPQRPDEEIFGKATACGDERKNGGLSIQGTGRLHEVTSWRCDIKSRLHGTTLTWYDISIAQRM